MNRLLKILIISSLFLVCEKVMAQESQIGGMLKGQHALQTVTVLPSDTNPTSITMTWEMNDRRSAVITISIERIQIEFNQALASPF
ncbi:MAG: hypothetical protein WC375_09860, partial [Methanomassiliicoccales archaeon]